MNVDDHRNRLLAGEAVGKVRVGISRWFGWDLDKFWRVRWDRDGVGIFDTVDELTLGARARA